jgi:hypothetical protein
MNLKLTKIKDKSGRMSDESKYKMRLAKLGKKASDEVKLKMKQNNGRSKKVICMISKKEWNCLVDCARENNINENTLRIKLSGNFNNNTSFLYKENKPKKGINYLCERIIKKKYVLCTETNKIWNTTKECALDNNLNRSTLISKLCGSKNNNTTFKYVYEI